MRLRLVMIALAATALIACAVTRPPAHAQTTTQAATEQAQESRDPPPAIAPETLKDAAMIAQGEKLWQDQCTHCHGAKAYPGKAPKLAPRTYKPEFVWDRIHNGFRAMPPWKEVYEPNEVLAIVAYVLSDDFFP
jgi:mono/diheme cytochrome c family protein